MQISIDDPRLPERFWDKVMPEPNSGCWLWTAYCKPNGYAQFTFAKGDVRYGHRVAYESLVKKIPNGMHIDHLCRVRNCVNPQHMEVVTPRQNVLRGDAPIVTAARHRKITHCPQGHPYSGSNLYTAPNGNRHCRICVRTAGRCYRAKSQ